MLRALLADSRLRQWFSGRTAPERGRIVLRHRRVYILPTRIGWLFGATVGILLVGSINYALQLGFALTFLLAGVGLVGMVHTTRNLARLSVSAGRVEPAFAGEIAQFRLHLENLEPHDRPAILVRHLESGVQTVLDLGRRAVADAVLSVSAAKRGWLPLGRVMLETRFPLGLFRAWSYVEPQARCLVYPRPERAPLPPHSAAPAAGGLHSPSPGNDDFAGLRSYQLSDSPRHVAWKAVARLDGMLTKQFAGEAAAELWLDWQALPAALDPETRLSRMAGWVLAADRSGAHYGLRLPGREISPARGDAQRAMCLEALALYPPS
jgi:uncharacterized protein (DUF58 family)